MPSSVVTWDQKVDVEPPSLSGGEGVELLHEQASLLGLGDKCSPHDSPVILNNDYNNHPAHSIHTVITSIPPS